MIEALRSLVPAWGTFWPWFAVAFVDGALIIALTVRLIRRYA